ncbi:LOW QUALITY PROTEIN: hypothetical protein HID58_087631, partial [Brassica napus]
RCVVERGDIQLSKTQTTWELEYLTNLFLALVVDSAGDLCTLFLIPFTYESKTNADFLLSLSPHMCGTTLRFFYLGNYCRRDPRERPGLAASPITVRMKVKVHESDMTAKPFTSMLLSFNGIEPEGEHI